jgi:hypothetical protein
MHTPKHFVILTGESKNFRMLELRVPLNIFLEKKALVVTISFIKYHCFTVPTKILFIVYFSLTYSLYFGLEASSN